MLCAVTSAPFTAPLGVGLTRVALAVTFTAFNCSRCSGLRLRSLATPSRHLPLSPAPTFTRSVSTLDNDSSLRASYQRPTDARRWQWLAARSTQLHSRLAAVRSSLASSVTGSPHFLASHSFSRFMTSGRETRVKEPSTTTPTRPSDPTLVHLQREAEALREAQSAVQPDREFEPPPVVDLRSTAAEIVLKTPGLSAFLGRVYRTMGMSFIGTSTLAYAVTLSHLPVESVKMLTWCGLALTLASTWALSRTVPETMRRVEDSTQLYTRNSTARRIAFGTFVAGAGLLLSPAVSFAHVVVPFFVPIIVGASTLTMLGSSVFVHAHPSGPLRLMSVPLVGALFSVISLQLAAFASYVLLGPNVFAEAMMSLESYLGIGLFAAAHAADTQEAIREYRQGEADHLVHVVTFHRNFFTVVWRLMDKQLPRRPRPDPDGTPRP